MVRKAKYEQRGEIGVFETNLLIVGLVGEQLVFQQIYSKFGSHFLACLASVIKYFMGTGRNVCDFFGVLIFFVLRNEMICCFPGNWVFRRRRST